MPPLLIGNYGAATAAAVRRWFLEHRPDVIIGCTCESLALLSRAKIRVPEEAAFAAFQILRPGRDIAGLDHPPGTVISKPACHGDSKQRALGFLMPAVLP